MADSRARVVAEARRWIGTPYVHQASCRGAGSDCLGLVRGVWRAVHGAEPCPVPPYGTDWEAGVQLLAALRAHLRPAGPMAAGDVLVFRLHGRASARHLGILTETGASPRFVHAYSGPGVVESPLGPAWLRRIEARFDLI